MSRTRSNAGSRILGILVSVVLAFGLTPIPAFAVAGGGLVTGSLQAQSGSVAFSVDLSGYAGGIEDFLLLGYPEDYDEPVSGEMWTWSGEPYDEGYACVSFMLDSDVLGWEVNGDEYLFDPDNEEYEIYDDDSNYPYYDLQPNRVYFEVDSGTWDIRPIMPSPSAAFSIDFREYTGEISSFAVNPGDDAPAAVPGEVWSWTGEPGDDGKVSVDCSLGQEVAGWVVNGVQYLFDADHEQYSEGGEEGNFLSVKPDALSIQSVAETWDVRPIVGAPQSAHGVAFFGPWGVGSSNAADATATIYADGTLVFECADGVESSGLVQADDWSSYSSGALPWSVPAEPYWSSDPVDAKPYVKSVEFGRGVEPMSLAYYFNGMVNLESVNDLPATVTDMLAAFQGCSSLSSSPVIPEGVTSLESAFRDCESLAVTPGLPSTVSNMDRCFYGCESLTELPAGFSFPAGAATDQNTFWSRMHGSNDPLVTYCDSADYDKLIAAYDWSAARRKLVPRIPDGVTPYDETDAESVKIAFTLSNDGFPLAGNDGSSTPLTLVEEEIPYFDLSLYGLERYYRYHTAFGWGAYTDEVVVKRPTVLHAYIWLLERYYMGLEPNDCGKGTSGLMSHNADTAVHYLDGSRAYSTGRTPAFTPTQDATSLYMATFWGHGQNLMYFVNHAYPIMEGTTGATCDYATLSDGDVIDVGMFSWWDFYQNGGFCRFDADSYGIERGDELTVSTFKAGTSAASEGSPGGDELIETLGVAVYDSCWNKVADLEGQGAYSYKFDEPGIYYLLGTDPAAKDPQAACFAPAVAKVEVADTPDKDEEGYFLLDSAEDMAWFQEWVNAKDHFDAKAALATDIDISSLEWSGLGDDQGANIMDYQGVPADKAFSGVLDGRGHTLTVNFTAEPLVTLLSGAVKDLTIEGICAAPAAFAKLVTYGATLDGCENGCNVSGSMNVNVALTSGGIAALAVRAKDVNPSSADYAIAITGCKSSGDIVSDARWAGGMLGAVSTWLDPHSSWGDVLFVSECINEGDVLVTHQWGLGAEASLGGIVGYVGSENGFEISKCSNSGRIEAGRGAHSGGILGRFSGGETSYGMIVSHCVNSGDIVGTSTYAGGIAGTVNLYYSLVEKCSNTGAVSAEGTSGGIVGLSQAEITDCYNWGAITSVGNWDGKGTAGGVVGVQQAWQVPNTDSTLSALLTNCYNTGAVTSAEIAGAVVGSLSAGDVTAYWLEGTAESAFGNVVSGYSDQDKTQMKTAAEMRYDALIGELGEAYQASCPYPVLAWQEAAEHSWGKGTVTVEPTVGAEGEMTFTCAVCGETKTEVLSKADASEIQAAIDSAKAIDTSALTDEQKADLEAAIAAAEAAAGDEGTTASQLDAALAALELQTAKADAAVARAEAAAAQQAAIDAAKSACEAARIDYDPNKSPAENVAAANAAQQAALGVANSAAEEAAKKACEAAGVEYDPAKSPAENVAAANDAQQAKLAQAEKAAEAAEARAIAAETAQKAAEAASAGLKANPMKATGKTIKAKAKKKTRAAKAKAFQVEDAKGKVSFYKAKGNDKIAVKANGKVIVKKGLKRGKTYKVKVLVVAEGDKEFAPAAKTVILKVKVAKK